jgi:hypothetical protein
MSLSALAQAGDYALTVSSGTYTPLGSSATDANDVEADTDTEIVPIGFSFVFDGIAYDTVVASSNGFISFNQAAGSNTTNDLDGVGATSRPLAAPLWDDLDGKAPNSSTIARFETTGSAPNRIFTFEWYNFEWNWLSNDSTVSFQVKLYETSNIVEFVYDNNGKTPNSPSASIGLTGASTFLSVSGISAGAIVTSNTTETSNIDSVVTGQILTFTPPACPSPGFLSFTNIATDSVTLNFSGNGSGPWYINWGPTGFIQGSPTTNNDTTTVDSMNFTGLMASTEYDFYIRENCGANGLSNWAGPFTVQTLCAPFVAPYTQSFDGNSTPLCWSQNNTSGGPWLFTGSTNTVQCSAASDHTGNGGSFAWMDQSGGDAGVILETPEIDVSGLTVPFMEFYYWMCGVGYTPINMTFVEAWDGTNWVRVDSIGTATNGWELQGYDLAGFTYNSGLAKIRFRAESGGSTDDFWGDNAIDDVAFIEKPSCPLPTQLTVVSVELDSVVISWSSNETAFNIEYGAAPYTTGGGGTTISVTDTFAVLKNLAANTNYELYIQTDCGGSGTSAFTTALSFTTPCAPFVATYIENFDGVSWAPTTTYDNCWSVDPNTGFRWQVETGTTTSGNTGPDNDFSGSGQYIYTEATSGSAGDTARIMSPFIDISALSVPYLTFKYHMFGDGMGTLNVDFYNGTQWQNAVFSISGEQQGSGADAWADGTVNVSALSRTSDTVQFRFSGIRGTSFRSDMAVDEMRVAEAPPCPAPKFDSLTVLDPFSATFSWTSYSGSSNFEWGPAGFSQGSGTGTVDSSATSPDTLTGLMSNTCYDIYIQDTCGAANGTSTWIGPFNFCTPVTCPAPTALGIDPMQLTKDAAALVWTTGGATWFEVEYDSVGFTLGTGNRSAVNNDTLNISSLMPGIEYQFYVRDSCGPGDVSVWSGPFSFVTSFITNYLNDFNSTTTPFAWLEADGRLSSNTQFTSATSTWDDDNFGNVANAQRSQRVNIFAANQYEWAISPSIYLDPSINNLQVEFDAAITDFANTAQGYLGSDDTLAVVISTDNGNTWSDSNILWYVTANDTVDSTGEHIIIPLTAYTGYVRFGLYGGSTINDPEDVDLFIDHFEVRTPRACTSPSDLAVNAIGTDSAWVSWTAGDVASTDWSVIYTVGNQPASMGTVLSSTADSLLLSNLMDATEYCFYVVEQCATGFSDTIGSKCFVTQCLPFTAPYFEDFETSTAGCWSQEQIIGANDWSIATGSTPGATVTTAFSGTLNAQFTASSGGPHVTRFISPVIDVTPLNTVELSFWYAQEDWAGDQNYTAAYYRINESDPWVLVWGDSTDVPTWTKDSVIIPVSSTTLQIAFEGTDLFGRGNVLDDISIHDPAALCAAPSNLMASNANCDSITLSWTSDANATYSEVEYGLAGFTSGNGTIITNATSPITLTSLGLNTDYEFYVIDSCGTSISALAGPVSFKTDSLGPLVASFTSTQTSTTATDADVDFDAAASINAVSYSWTFGNGNSGTGVNGTANYTNNGTYDVTLTVTDRCGNTDDTTVTITVGGISILENVYNATVDMYPNPTTGVFRVNVSNGSSDYSVEVMDLSGRLIYKSNALSIQDEHTIDLGAKATGVYTVRIVGEGLNISRRLMVKKAPLL